MTILDEAFAGCGFHERAIIAVPSVSTDAEGETVRENGSDPAAAAWAY